VNHSTGIATEQARSVSDPLYLVRFVLARIWRPRFDTTPGQLVRGADFLDFLEAFHSGRLSGPPSPLLLYRIYLAASEMRERGLGSGRLVKMPSTYVAAASNQQGSPPATRHTAPCPPPLRYDYSGQSMRPLSTDCSRIWTRDNVRCLAGLSQPEAAKSSTRGSSETTCLILPVGNRPALACAPSCVQLANQLDCPLSL
jgi:hypothetical protein